MRARTSLRAAPPSRWNGPDRTSFQQSFVARRPPARSRHDWCRPLVLLTSLPPARSRDDCLPPALLNLRRLLATHRPFHDGPRSRAAPSEPPGSTDRDRSEHRQNLPAHRSKPQPVPSEPPGSTDRGRSQRRPNRPAPPTKAAASSVRTTRLHRSPSHPAPPEPPGSTARGLSQHRPIPPFTAALSMIRRASGPLETGPPG